jgi:hypothetical protein
LQIKNPHRLGILIEQNPILFFGFAELLFPLFAQRDFPLQHLVGVVQFGGAEPDLHFQFCAQLFLLMFDAEPFLEQGFDVHHADEEQHRDEEIEQIEG